MNQVTRKTYVLDVIDSTRYSEEVRKLSQAVPRIDDATTNQRPRKLISPTNRDVVDVLITAVKRKKERVKKWGGDSNRVGKFSFPPVIFPPHDF